MNLLTESIDSQTLLLVAAIAILVLITMLLVRIFKAASGLLLAIFLIILVLQYGFNISPVELLSEIKTLPQDVVHLLARFDFNSIRSNFSS